MDQIPKGETILNAKIKVNPEIGYGADFHVVYPGLDPDATFIVVQDNRKETKDGSDIRMIQFKDINDDKGVLNWGNM